MKIIKKLATMIGFVVVLVFGVQGASSAATMLEMVDCSGGFACDVGDLEFDKVYLNQESVDVGLFEHAYTFTLANDSNFSGIATDHPFLTSLDVADLEFSIFSDHGAPLGMTSGGAPLEISLLAGDYSMVVSGTGTGAAGGAYTASLEITAVPIPPAVLLLGSGILGLVAVAKRKRSVVTSDSTSATA